jgi:2-C-methyl-D-erythritol 4-phosphate cytidylyltransferase
MVIVGGGSSTRFGSDKLWMVVEGRPLLQHTYESVAEHVDTVVVVTSRESRARVERMRIAAVVTTGGPTRTLSEWAGLQALERSHDLIGIHDAARPVVSPGMIESLFASALETGGAAPLIELNELIVARDGLAPVTSVRRAQTPQVFRGDELKTAFHRAVEAGFTGHDTVEVVQRYGELAVVGVAGDATNVKVTYPEDIEVVSRHLASRSRT